MNIHIQIDDKLLSATRRALRTPAVVVGLGAAAVLATVSFASPLGSVPNTFAAGEVISASEMNANFAAVVSAIDAVDAEVSSVSGAVDGVDAAVSALEAWRTIGFKITAGGTVSNATFSPSPSLSGGPGSPYVITLPSGLFSGTPVCTATAAPSTTVAVSMGILPTSATRVELSCAYDFIDGNDGWCSSASDQFHIICIGPR